MIKCEWIATENICQKFYSFERKGKHYLILNFDLSLSSFRVKGGSEAKLQPIVYTSRIA